MNGGAIERTLPWQGGRLRYLLREGATPILFLHGLCCGAIYFDQAFRHAALQGYGIVALDLPGFGASQGMPLSQCGIEGQVDACLAVLRSVGVDRAWVVAHSMASSAAVRLAASTAGLVLLEGNLVPENLDFSDRLLAEPAGSFAETYTRIQKLAPSLLKMRTHVHDAEERARYAATFGQCRADVVKRVAEESNVDTRRGMQMALLQRATACYFVGEENSTLSDIVADRVPALRQRDVPRAGHFLMLDNPDATYAMIDEEIRGADAERVRC